MQTGGPGGVGGAGGVAGPHGWGTGHGSIEKWASKETEKLLHETNPKQFLAIKAEMKSELDKYAHDHKISAKTKEKLEHLLSQMDVHNHQGLKSLCKEFVKECK